MKKYTEQSLDVSIADCWTIYHLYKDGCKIWLIASSMDIPEYTVRYILRKLFFQRKVHLKA